MGKLHLKVKLTDKFPALSETLDKSRDSHNLDEFKNALTKAFFYSNGYHSPILPTLLRYVEYSNVSIVKDNLLISVDLPTMEAAKELFVLLRQFSKDHIGYIIQPDSKYWGEWLFDMKENTKMILTNQTGMLYDSLESLNVHSGTVCTNTYTVNTLDGMDMVILYRPPGFFGAL